MLKCPGLPVGQFFRYARFTDPEEAESGSIRRAVEIRYSEALWSPVVEEV